MGEPMTDDEVEASGWERADEVRRTWAGDLTIDPAAREAILTVEQTEVVTFRLRIPRERIRSLIQELDWAHHRLEPWVRRHGAPYGRDEEETRDDA